MLRVYKKLRTYGPDDQKKEDHKGPHIDVVYSFFRTKYSLTFNKLRGFGNVDS